MHNLEQKSLLYYLETTKKFIDYIISSICIFIVGLMTILVTYQVVARYLFNSPSNISEVLSRYLFIWLILFGGAYVFGLREHMSIEFLKNKFSEKTQIILDMFSEFTILTFVVSIMIYGGFNASVRQMFQVDSALNLPIGVIYSAIPISGAITIFYFIYNEFKLYSKLKELNN
ncbi:TRAP transporter small permease [Actinobacillus lignieresii]|uniref:TRAP transporter small permease protein n=1 Tax=Actinobacillus lignieresii TaxID=720 RepID=A0A380TQL8_ACTLI|nr:TRAP transporter small permease [Actinobacillus lignieresii]SUT90433.1 tripartite ATP-independent periplasmic transporter DctQ [Actinobacillus lignieresii]SUT95337.1 tripartite ATP-independent periplasmic transporter DctQ [Actinobacillus lignieresii]VEB25567.1 tripartite ATP-independent periplasmic transporter DctQ [Actinobacillus lignieresii]